MDIETMQARAVEVRSRFAAFETATYGQEWTTEDLVIGLMTDVGDLASLVSVLQGKRPSRHDDPLSALGHEISDCMWVLLVLADRFDIDVASAFETTMDGISEWIEARS